ncbi:two-component system sensor histidine kinase YesM [Paenibacillus sp. PastF-3]|uniref:cache domain-containing sensor histidine kinase n=1 Tax=unclassified Paenibacillus TaxID=185978 RepID=UPI000BA16C4F|nr:MULTISPECIES: sensor histidine kinase [unclassified Paenibacillus]MDH6368753.1 two-component system sensor histidine kinase YesM [Paenibacillus sp. PastF-3]OZQ98577.1 two-component sensor histidine kinase [Paenibacillus sp. VTT E-133291]
MYARIITLVNNLKLRTKLFLSFGCVVLIPVLIVGLFLTIELRNMAMANALEQITANVDRVKKRTGEMLNVPIDIAYRLSNDSRLEEVANHHYESVYDVVEAYWNYPDFRDFVRLYNEVSSIRLYIDNPTILDNWEFLQTSENVTQEQWYQTALNQRGLVCWNYIRDNRNGRYYLSLIRKVNFFKERTTGVLVVNVNTNKLNAILNQESFETLIMDENDNIVASNRVDTQDKSLTNIDLITLSATGQGPHNVTIDGKPFKMVIDHWQPGGSSNSLRIISIFSVASIVDEPNQIIFLASIVVLSALFMAILLIYYVSRLLTGRILHLSKHISKVASGNLEATLVIDGKDEIGQLARQFNHMVRNIKELMSEVQESNRQKNAIQLKQNEIKFKMMASQINPHFLFNALESIRMKTLVRGQADISQVVRLLGKMMRKNLEVGNGMISLQSELETVSCYLVIQKFRYDDRLTYELHVDPRANPLQIPPLIIQPLVENCVIHGLENRIDGGMIRVEIRLEDHYLKVQVSDNGAGISKARIQEIIKMLDHNDDYETNSIGIRNIHLRLQLTYGPQFGLTLTSQIGFGTQISFAIPLRSDSYV